MYDPYSLASMSLGVYPPPIMGTPPFCGMTGPTYFPSCYNQAALGMGPFQNDVCSFSTPSTSSARKVWDFTKTWGPLFLLSYVILKAGNAWNAAGNFFSGGKASNLGRLSPK